MKRPAGRLFVLVDAHYRDDVRFLELDDPLAELLYLRGLAWSKAQNTDGRIPRVVVERRLAEDLVRLDSPLIDSSLAARLVAVGLWEEDGDGWRIPPERWARWQTTAEEQDAQRAAKAERQARYRAKKASTERRATSRRPSTESRATPRSPSHSHSHSQSNQDISSVSTSPLSSSSADADTHTTTTDDRVLEAARALAELDLERRQSERADAPIAQPARWLTVAAARRLEQDADRIVELLGHGLTPAEVAATFAADVPIASMSRQARARRARLNGTPA